MTDKRFVNFDPYMMRYIFGEIHRDVMEIAGTKLDLDLSDLQQLDRFLGWIAAHGLDDNFRERPQKVIKEI